MNINRIELDSCSYEQISFLTNENSSYFRTEKANKRSMAYEKYNRLCKDVAREINFNMKSKGTKYFIDALLFLFTNDLSIRQSNQAFIEIAQKYNTSVERVRANITDSLKSMKRFSKTATLNEVFPKYDGRNPSLIYSLELALDKLEMYEEKTNSCC